jgi:hypothetical protein
MTSRDFCFWLQGYFECGVPVRLSERETEMVKRHLALVFKHEIDPSMPDPTGILQATHDGKESPLNWPTDGTAGNPVTYRC